MKKAWLIRGLWLCLVALLCVLAVRESLRSNDAGVRLSAGAAAESITIEGKVVHIRLAAPSATDSPEALMLTPSPVPTLSPTPSPVPTPFGFYWISDTQIYAYRLPSVLTAMARYVCASYEEHSVVALLQTGDIVDKRSDERQWKNIVPSFSSIKEQLPLYCVAGNHDVGADLAEYEIYSSFALCTEGKENSDYKGGVCWYRTLNAGGTDFIIVGIGWQTDTDYVQWVNRALYDHKDCVAIIVIHNYLKDDGSLSGNGKLVDSLIVNVNPNVRLVLCGHAGGSVCVTRWYDSGSRSVTAMMYNFQDDREAGLGYLRLLMFNPLTRNIAVTTYSPFLDDFNYYTDEDEIKDTFTIRDAF